MLTSYRERMTTISAGLALAQRDDGAHGQGVGAAVQGAGALGIVARLTAAAVPERQARPSPQGGGGALDQQHLSHVRLAAVAPRSSAVAGAAGRAVLHSGYSR